MAKLRIIFILIVGRRIGYASLVAVFGIFKVKMTAFSEIMEDKIISASRS